MKLKLISLSLILATQAFAGPESIYGTDDRKDIYEVTNPAYLRLAKSTAAMIRNERMKSVNEILSSIEHDDITYKDNACSDSKFTKQPAAASCSGFLVAEDVIATAGHCLKQENSCEGFKWVFDFQLDHANSVLESRTRMDAYKIEVPNSNIYSCKRVIVAKKRDFNSLDYALVQLDRKVVDRAPLKVRESGKIKEGTPVVVIGNPSGLPTKVADNAQVKAGGRNYFNSNVDTFHGNSGSAIFNVETEEVEGILVSGDADYTFDKKRKCNVINVYRDNNQMFESATRITSVRELKDLLKGKLK